MTIHNHAYAQPKASINRIHFNKQTQELNNALCGGFNVPVISTFDFNGDGKKDIFIYEKSAHTAHVYINNQTTAMPSYYYDPSYDGMIPDSGQNWVLMRDYNRDGVPDLFMDKQFSIAVYTGQMIGGKLQFSSLTQRLTYAQFIPGLYMYGPPDVLPAIVDVDGDGDLDILTWELQNSYIEYYYNAQADSSLSKDSIHLHFDNHQTPWGCFYDDGINSTLNLLSCKDGMVRPPQQDVHERHTVGGLSIYTFDKDMDGDQDLLLGNIYKDNIIYAQNDGSIHKGHVLTYDSIFPAYNIPVKMPQSPAAYGIDGNGDGREDLYISPFVATPYQTGVENAKCIQYYRNLAHSSDNEFSYENDVVLTATTVDVGSYSTPRFFDYDRDGLIDIVIGNFYKHRQFGQDTPIAALTLYRNTGTATTPKYSWVSDDWNNLHIFHLSNGLFPAFGDLNGDHKPDMIAGDLTGHLSLYLNNGSTLNPFAAQTSSNYFSLTVPQNAIPYLYDVNNDGLTDIVVGNHNDSIFYFWNFGTTTNAQFSTDSVNRNFGKLSVYAKTGDSPPYLSPTIAKEGTDLMLYVGTGYGTILKYKINPDSLRRGAFPLLSADVIGTRMGKSCVLDIADINGDGQREYLIGNVAGGLSLYSEVYWEDTSVHPQAVVATTPTAINEITTAGNELHIYPNPVRDKIRCVLEGLGVAIQSVAVCDMTGRVVYEIATTHDSHIVDIPVSQIEAGMYIVTIYDGGGSIYYRKINIVR